MGDVFVARQRHQLPKCIPFLLYCSLHSSVLIWFQGLAVAVVPVIGFCGEVDIMKLKISPAEVIYAYFLLDL